MNKTNEVDVVNDQQRFLKVKFVLQFISKLDNIKDKCTQLFLGQISQQQKQILQDKDELNILELNQKNCLIVSYNKKQKLISVEDIEDIIQDININYCFKFTCNVKNRFRKYAVQQQDKSFNIQQYLQSQNIQQCQSKQSESDEKCKINQSQHNTNIQSNIQDQDEQEDDNNKQGDNNDSFNSFLSHLKQDIKEYDSDDNCCHYNSPETIKKTKLYLQTQLDLQQQQKDILDKKQKQQKISDEILAKQLENENLRQKILQQKLAKLEQQSVQVPVQIIAQQQQNNEVAVIQQNNNDQQQQQQQSPQQRNNEQLPEQEMQRDIEQQIDNSEIERQQLPPQRERERDIEQQEQSIEQRDIEQQIQQQQEQEYGFTVSRINKKNKEVIIDLHKFKKELLQMDNEKKRQQILDQQLQKQQQPSSSSAAAVQKMTQQMLKQSGIKNKKNIIHEPVIGDSMIRLQERLKQ